MTPTSSRTADVQQAVLLTYITLAWMTIEGVASLLLGVNSQSLLLEAFGLDSGLELISAYVLLWRLTVELKANASETRIESVERRAAKIVGWTLYFLAA